MNLLDCTFRDGGYYNNWEFSNSELNQYLEFINNNNIQIIEIGFRFLKKNKFYGPFAFSSDFFLKNLKLLNKKKISVMINAKDYYLDKNLILNNFSLKKNSIIDIVRIAVNYDEFHKCKDLVSVLKKLGYEVGFNLMKANYIDKSLAIKIFKELKSWNNIDVLYFADSLGCMENDDIFRLSNLINLYWGKEFGIHAHNNKGLAISNSLKALECGATWVDTTILGMGRGAGNAPTESLLIELKSKNKIKTINFTDLSLFHSLKNKYKWGYSPFYHYSATYMIPNLCANFDRR